MYAISLLTLTHVCNLMSHELRFAKIDAWHMQILFELVRDKSDTARCLLSPLR